MELTFLARGDDSLRNKLLDPEDKTTSKTLEITTLQEAYIAMIGMATHNCQLLIGSLIQPVTDEVWGNNYNKYSMLHFIVVDAAVMPWHDTSHIKMGDRYILQVDRPIPAHTVEQLTSIHPDVTAVTDRVITITSPELVPKKHAMLNIPEETAQHMNDTPPPQPDIKWLAFINRQADQLWAGDVDTTNRTHTLYQTSKLSLANFLKIRGADPAMPLEEWTMSFDPTSDTFIDTANNHFNLYTPSDYIRNATKRTVADIPPSIKTILMSLCGDDVTLTHFINWIAYKMQTRRKMRTAWVFTGTQGTGKGILFDKILAPIFKAEYCRLMTLDTIADTFSSYIETSLFVGIDEAHVGNSAAGTKLLNKLKNRITEPLVEVRRMRTDTYSATNYCEYIFFSNHTDAMRIHDDDRRFNVAPHQHQSMTRPTEAFMADIKAELPEFADYLWSYDVDLDAVDAPLENEHKARMAQNSSSQHDQFFNAVKSGRIDYFMEVMDHPHHEYIYFRDKVRTIIYGMLLYATETGESFVSLDALVTLYAAALGRQENTRTMKVWVGHNGFDAITRQPSRFGDSTRPRGLTIELQFKQDEREELMKILDIPVSDANVTPITGTHDANNNP
jgi:hypothetical protein